MTKNEQQPNDTSLGPHASSVPAPHTANSKGTLPAAPTSPKLSALGPHASRVPAPHTANSKGTLPAAPTCPKLSALPNQPPNTLTAPKSSACAPNAEVFSVSNSPISASSAPAAAHSDNGSFAPGNPWRFQPGQSGNPKGRPPRPKFKSLSEVLRDRLSQPLPDAPEKNYAEIIGDLIFKAALTGNQRAIDRLFDRTEGRPRQPIGRQTTSLVDSDEWIRLRDTICAALEPFPEVQAAVIKAIDKMEDPSEEND